MIEGSIQEGAITIVNTYEPNIGAPQYIREIPTIMEGKINSYTIIVGNFNTPTYIKGQIMQTEDQQGVTGLKRQVRDILLVQWMRIHLQMQGTWVQSLVSEDST